MRVSALALSAAAFLHVAVAFSPSPINAPRLKSLSSSRGPPDVEIEPEVIEAGPHVVQAYVISREGEPLDSMIMRFRREVNKSGHLRVLRHKRYFEEPREKKKRKAAELRLKRKFERQRSRRQNQMRSATGGPN